MENWLLNWSAWLTMNTHAEIDDFNFEDGPDWYYAAFKAWQKNSMYGQDYERHKTAFSLSESQQNKLDEWKGHIKAVFGEYGNYEYIFNASSGIGIKVSVYSELADRELDLTEVENW
jgi:hypothetical protein